MKNILIPVDFSSFSYNALNAGIKVAKKINANIHLLHVVTEFSDSISNSFESNIKENLKLNIGEWAMVLLEEMKSTVQNQDIKCRVKCVYDKFIPGIEHALREENYELLIIGSHGASGKEEWFIGSNAQKIIRKIHKNVLIIKQPVLELEFSKVVYVTGLSIKDKGTFARFLKFLEPYQVKEVHILTVNTIGYLAKSDFQVRDFFEDFKSVSDNQNITTHFYPDFTVEAGVRHFAEEFDMELIGISNTERHPVKRIFFGSNVELIVNHSNVPVLSFDYEYND